MRKEFFEQSAAFVAKDSRANLGPVVESRVAQQVPDRASHPCFVVPRTENNAG